MFTAVRLSKLKMDQSIEDVLRVTNILKNINFGWEGYLQPHFVMDKDDLVSLIDRELGIFI